MRYREIYFLPSTPEEAKNAVVDFLTVEQSRGITEVPAADIIRMLSANFQIDRRMLIKLIGDTPPVKRISDGIVYLKSEADDLEDPDVVSDDEEEKSQKKVEKMAKKALKKKKGD